MSESSQRADPVIRSCYDFLSKLFGTVISEPLLLRELIWMTHTRTGFHIELAYGRVRRVEASPVVRME